MYQGLVFAQKRQWTRFKADAYLGNGAAYELFLVAHHREWDITIFKIRVNPRTRPPSDTVSFDQLVLCEPIEKSKIWTVGYNSINQSEELNHQEYVEWWNGYFDALDISMQGIIRSRLREFAVSLDGYLSYWVIINTMKYRLYLPLQTFTRHSFPNTALSHLGLWCSILSHRSIANVISAVGMGCRGPWYAGWRRRTLSYSDFVSNVTHILSQSLLIQSTVAGASQNDHSCPGMEKRTTTNIFIPFTREKLDWLDQKMKEVKSRKQDTEMSGIGNKGFGGSTSNRRISWNRYLSVKRISEISRH